MSVNVKNKVEQNAAGLPTDRVCTAREASAEANYSCHKPCCCAATSTTDRLV